MPGQEHGYRVSVTADHTALAPTILDIAGLPRPSWMRGGSLVPWLTRDGEGGSEGLAFTQFLETDSIVEPLRSGTVGVVDGNHQCVLDIATGKAKLRSLAQAHLRDLDCSDENPALAQKLREVIYARFPDLPRLKA
jgi:arylsulfatase A-like enzyme